MNNKELTKRELLLRERALKVARKSLPDQVRSAYEVGAVEERDASRALLVARGYLREDELNSLPVNEAIDAAQERLSAQIADLQKQTETLTRLEKGTRARGTNVPRTLRQG